MKHIAQLDGIRFFAIIGVIIAHWIVWDTTNEFVKSFPWGNGVILFFVLSGYLITNILLELKNKIEHKEISFKKALFHFYIRRFLRIFPIYYATVFFLRHINYQNVEEISPWLLTFTSNFYHIITLDTGGQFAHFWSLAIEEQFYLFWPLFILLLNKKHLFKVMVIIILASILSRIICVEINKENWLLGSYFSFNLAMPLALGGLVAYLQRHNKRVFDNLFARKIFFYLSGIFYLTAYYLMKTYSLNFLKNTMDEYFFAIFAAFFVANAAESKFNYLGKLIMENKIIVYIGTISYGLYIYHMFMTNLYMEYIAVKMDIHTNLKYTYWIFYFIVLILLGSISYYVIEKPLNSLKKYFPY